MISTGVGMLIMLACGLNLSVVLLKLIRLIDQSPYLIIYFPFRAAILELQLALIKGQFFQTLLCDVELV